MHLSGFGRPIAQAHMGLNINHWRVNLCDFQAFKIGFRVKLGHKFRIPVFDVHIHESTAKLIAVIIGHPKLFLSINGDKTDLPPTDISFLLIPAALALREAFCAGPLAVPDASVR